MADMMSGRAERGTLFARAYQAVRTMRPPDLPPLLRWSSALLAIAACVLIQEVVLPDPTVAPFAFAYLGVAVAGWLGGRAPGLLAAVLGALSTNYVFMKEGFVWATDPTSLEATGLFVTGSAFVALLCGCLRETLLRETERGADLDRRHADLLLLSHDAILVWRWDGSLESWNRGAEELYGYRAAEAVGRVSHDLLKTVFPVPLDAIEATLRRKGRWEGRLAHRTKDGRIVTVAARLQLVRGHDGVARVLETNRDVTELRRVEEEREHLLASERAARSDAERAARMRDEFVATVSHELRTPLNAILGWSNILRGGKLEPAATRRALEVIERNARAQAQLVEDLLDVSRILSGKLRFQIEHVDLAAVVDNAVAAVLPDAEAKEVRVEKIVDTRAAVQGDPSRLEQITANLLSNAVKFTPRGGSVLVTLGTEGSRARLEVRDTGQGIGAELLPYLFERYRQGDGSITRKHGGLGIGLALVKHLVEQHGGQISAHSEGEGKGATFVVSLPISAARGMGEGPTPLEACASLEGVSVLIADDDEDGRDLVRRILEDCGANVVAVGSAGEVMEELPRRRPDVLISDIGMPEMDGYELMCKVRALPRERGGKTPAVALTAFSRPDDRLRALRVGYQMHLSKPVEQAELLVVVANLAGRLAA